MVPMNHLGSNEALASLKQDQQDHSHGCCSDTFVFVSAEWHYLQAVLQLSNCSVSAEQRVPSACTSIPVSFHTTTAVCHLLLLQPAAHAVNTQSQTQLSAQEYDPMDLLVSAAAAATREMGQA